MAAVQASQSDFCGSCKKSLIPSADSPLSAHVCSACGAPQRLRGNEDYFNALGVLPRFEQDRALLEKRFYEISRALHPDRFSTSDADARAASLERMSFVNEAYQTLRSPEKLRKYLLARHGIQVDSDSAANRALGDVQAVGSAHSSQRSTIPMELAESWFELQDALMEDPAAAKEKLAGFQTELQSLKTHAQEELERIEHEIDTRAQDENESAEALYQQLAAMIQKQSYLKSMERDVERIRGKFGRT